MKAAQNHVAEILAELRSLDPFEVGEIFVNRQRDEDFALIGAMVGSRNAPFEILVWHGYNEARQNRYAGT